ncbi:MAG: hypothetical protein PHX45_01045 [Acidobacteriota bacterium]|nr:hypothetical protein [Acidobacteriota bacterium]
MERARIGKIDENRGVFLRWLSSYVIFLYALQVSALGLSLLQIRITAWTARGIVGVSVAAALMFFYAGSKESGPFPPGDDSRRRRIPFLIFLGVAAAVYLVLWAAAAVMPDVSWDGNAYHIPSLSMWDARGYVHWIDTGYLEPIINGYPKGAELTAYIIVKAFGNSLINAVNLVFLPVGALGVACLSFLLGATAVGAAVAGAAYILIPINIHQSVTTYVDSAFASCVIAMMALAASVFLASSPKVRRLAVFGAAVGLVLSVKGTGPALSCLAMAGAAWIRVKAGFTGGRETRTPPDPRGVKKALGGTASMLLIVGMVALAGGGYWYARNLARTGTPLYPVGATFLGHRIFPGITVSETLSGQHNIPPHMRAWSPAARVLYSWAQGLNAWPESIQGYDTRSGGLGFLWVLGCVPAVLLSIARRRKMAPSQKQVLYFLLAVVGIAFIVTPLNWWGRFTLWIYGLGLPCFALVVTRLVLTRDGRASARRAGFAWLALCLALLLFEGIFSTARVVSLASRGQPPGSLGNLFKPSRWNWPACYLFPEMRNTVMERILGQRADVAMGPHGKMEFWLYAGLVGQLSQPVGARRLIFLDGPGEPENMPPGVKYVIWDETLPLPPSLKPLRKSGTSVGGFLVLPLADDTSGRPE